MDLNPKCRCIWLTKIGFPHDVPTTIMDGKDYFTRMFGCISSNKSTLIWSNHKMFQVLSHDFYAIIMHYFMLVILFSGFFKNAKIFTYFEVFDSLCHFSQSLYAKCSSAFYFFNGFPKMSHFTMVPYDVNLCI